MRVVTCSGLAILLMVAATAGDCLGSDSGANDDEGVDYIRHRMNAIISEFNLAESATSEMVREKLSKVANKFEDVLDSENPSRSAAIQASVVLESRCTLSDPFFFYIDNLMSRSIEQPMRRYLEDAMSRQVRVCKDMVLVELHELLSKLEPTGRRALEELTKHVIVSGSQFQKTIEVPIIETVERYLAAVIVVPTYTTGQNRTKADFDKHVKVIIDAVAPHQLDLKTILYRASRMPPKYILWNNEEMKQLTAVQIALIMGPALLTSLSQFKQSEGIKSWLNTINVAWDEDLSKFNEERVQELVVEAIEKFTERVLCRDYPGKSKQDYFEMLADNLAELCEVNKVHVQGCQWWRKMGIVPTEKQSFAALNFGIMCEAQEMIDMKKASDEWIKRRFSKKGKAKILSCLM